MHPGLPPVLFLLVLVPASTDPAFGQSDSLLLDPDEFTVQLVDHRDATAPITAYEPLNPALGGDSVRRCGTVPCSGWLEDRYADGSLLHRGSYAQGRLTAYSNFRSSGLLERSFELLENGAGELALYDGSGVLRSKVAYVRGDPFHIRDFYPNGQLRFEEIKHPSDPYSVLIDLFEHDGTPIRTTRVIDPVNATIEYKEYWANGRLRMEGCSRFDPRKFKPERVGEWRSYADSGMLISTTAYVEGKPQQVALVVR